VRPLASLLVAGALAATLPTGHAQTPAQRPIIPPANPASSAANASGAAGLCQCLYPPSLPNTAWGKTHLRFACLGVVDQCKSTCNTTTLYSFIPTVPYSCAAPSAEQPNQVASSRR
jgi:hypothetical protein